MRIYLDTCAIQRPYDDRGQLRVRVEAEAVLAVLAAVRAGAVDLLVSDVLRFEVANHPSPERRLAAEGVLSLGTHAVATTDAVALRARTYVAAGLRPLDAVHLASAVEGGAAYFCTTDDRLLRRAGTAETGPTVVLSPLTLVAALDP